MIVEGGGEGRRAEGEQLERGVARWQARGRGGAEWGRVSEDEGRWEEGGQQMGEGGGRGKAWGGECEVCPWVTTEWRVPPSLGHRGWSVVDGIDHL